MQDDIGASMPEKNTTAPSGQHVRNRRMDPVVKNYSLGLIVVFLIIASFVAGVFFGDVRPAAVAEAPTEDGVRLVNRDDAPPFRLNDVDFSEFWEVWGMVKERFAGEQKSDVEMFYGAIAGMVSSLEDPYSTFFDPDSADEFIRELEGTFEGIGTEIGIKKDQLTVIAPLPDTPAERAGLRAGDKIIAIDDTDTFGMSLEEAVKRIRGPKGTEVGLRIVRKGLDESLEIPITRDRIVVDSVRMTIEEQEGKKIAIVKISHFNEQTMPKFSAFIQDILLEDVDGFILDLRNNPGGFLETAVKVAGEWSPRSVIVVEKFSDGSSQNYTSNGNARLVDMPTVVLVNGGSASASEIVSGALQDYGKARIIGEQTFGKGSVQDYVGFDDGSALKLTIAQWLTPNGRSINEEGIEPDEVVEYTFEDYDNDVDPQLRRAMEVLIHPETISDPDDEEIDESDV